MRLAFTESHFQSAEFAKPSNYTELPKLISYLMMFVSF